MADQPQAVPPPAAPKEKAEPKVAGADTQLDLDTIMCIKRAMKVTFQKMCNITFPGQPQITKNPIIQWQGRMRVLKPQDTKFISVITFKHCESKAAKYEVHGVAALFVTEDVATIMMQGLGLKGLKEEDDILDGIGEFLNVISGSFKAELNKEGYPEMDISTPHNFALKVDELFEYYKSDKFDMVFPLDEENKIYLELAVSSILQKKTKA